MIAERKPRASRINGRLNAKFEYESLLINIGDINVLENGMAYRNVMFRIGQIYAGGSLSMLNYLSQPLGFATHRRILTLTYSCCWLSILIQLIGTFQLQVCMGKLKDDPNVSNFTKFFSFSIFQKLSICQKFNLQLPKSTKN